MGRLFCNGKKGYCEKDSEIGVICANCEFYDGSGSQYIDIDNNHEYIQNMTIEEMARFLKSLLDGENNHNVGCYGCSHYGTHHSDIKNKGTDLYECEGCVCEGIGLDLVKWLKLPGYEFVEGDE